MINYKGSNGFIENIDLQTQNLKIFLLDYMLTEF